jgi:hypothetical protein
MARWEFESRFRAKVRHAVAVSRKTNTPPNITPTPSEAASAKRLLLKGQLQPGDMRRWTAEEVANVR